MEEVLKQIISMDNRHGMRIDSALLKQYTKKLTVFQELTIRWESVKYLYLVDDAFERHLRVHSGCYADETGQWVLLRRDLGLTSPYSSMILSRCGSNLEVLGIFDSNERKLNLRKVTGLKTLWLVSNSFLQEILGMDRLAQLETLVFHNNGMKQFTFSECHKKLRQVSLSDNYSLEEVRGLSHLSELEILDLSETKIRRIQLEAILPRLCNLDASRTQISDLGFLQKLPALEFLCMYQTHVSSVKELEGMKALKRATFEYCRIRSLDGVHFPDSMEMLIFSDCEISSIDGVILPENLLFLYLDGCPIAAMDGVTLPTGLRKLGLGGTELQYLPESIRNLRDLTNLNLRSLKLRDLPDWLPELGLTIGMGEGYGINLENTEIENVDMSIFFQSQKIIRAWFESRSAGRRQNAGQRSLPDAKTISDEIRPLNELKVVFLGDGGSGKSRTIARLLLDGRNTENFPNVSTPGIVIQDKSYRIGDRDVTVHFWDFGGQDILHSMHRMFLTRRTLYVVMVNVRDGNQDERARYWLHNLRSFADGAPVLLVLNQMDSNRNAKVNLPDLRTLYPELTEVVAMSALEDDAESVQDNLVAALKRQIGAFEILESPFLPSWRRLKDTLQNMTESYIRSERFEQYCCDCGVEESDEIRLSLLSWFSDLGVSFYYGKSVRFRDFVVLRPDWLTNAIYTIIFNKSEKIENGLISHETIYELLNPKPEERKMIRQAIEGMVYEKNEVDYVLNVIRKFRLSFLVSEDVEFIPMLCQADTLPIAEEYERDPETLEFRLEYDYLPNNVLHRLMVDLRGQLDTRQVWRTGALFRQQSTGLSAVVKSEGDVLRIFVRGENPLFRPHSYLNLIRDTLMAIHKSMNLREPESLICYKWEGEKEDFRYDMLIGSLESGIPTVYSQVKRGAIRIQDILEQTDREVIRRKQKLLEDVAGCCIRMRGRKMFWKAGEDERNTELRDLMLSKGYDTADQTLNGVSPGGRRAGELDLLIRDENRLPWVVCEALNLDGGGKSQLEYWERHLDKLLVNYNPEGLRDLILLSYVSAPTDKFARLWQVCSEHMRWYDPQGALRRDGTYQEYPLLRESYDCLRVGRCTYDRGGMPVHVYHYFLRMGE